MSDPSHLPKPPRTFQEFVERHPKLGQAWKTLTDAGTEGPLDAKTARLVKLGIAIGAQKEGAVHAGVRKGVAAGVTPDEMQQVVALAASTIGMPGAVAAFSWIQDLQA